jgi:formate hydrogenlyase subunit 4
MKILALLLQFITLCLLAPLISGCISKMKNNLRMRRGAPVLQPYYNIMKLFSKDEVVSETASWIFRIAPAVYLSSSLAALMLVPAIIAGNPARFAGDFLAIIFIFTLGRFFMALAGLDAGSSFGGMGSSREMFIASLAEPAGCLAVFSLFLQTGTTNPELMGISHPHIATILAGLCLMMVILAETSRIPIDNQETHLELTMIHEAMVLEYSGRPLAFIEIGSYIKQIIWFGLLGHLLFPTTVLTSAGLIPLCVSILFFCCKIIVLAAFVAVLEVLIAKMRLFRVVDYFGFAIVFGALAVITSLMGI